MSATPSNLTESEAAQLSQTIEMFEVITRSDPSDYQSLEILKEAYSKLGREKDLIDTSKRIAQVYVQLGQLSSAILEYETVLQRFPDDKEVQMALKEIDARAHNFASSEAQAHAQANADAPHPQRSTESHQTTHRIRDKAGSGGEIDDGRQSMQKVFVDSKLVSPGDFDICWKTPDPQASPPGVVEPFIQILNDKGIVQTDKSLKLIIEKTRLAYLPMEKYDVDLELVRSFPADVCRRWCVLPFDRMSKTLLVATANPFNRQVIKELTHPRHTRVLFFISPPLEISGNLRKMFRSPPMPPIIKSFGERIADALVEDGLLTLQQVEELLEEQKKGGTRVLKLVVEKAYVSEQDMTVCMGRILNTPPVNLSRISIPAEVVDLLPRDLAHNYKVVPVSRLENKLFLAMADPLNVLAIDDVRRVTRLEVHPLISSERSILEKLTNIDASKSSSMEDIINESSKIAEDDPDAEKLEVAKETAEDVNLDQLAQSSGEAPVIKLANIILVQAIKDRASDIHIEPFEKNVRLRYRVDGTLLDVTPPPKAMQLALASRFKIMSSLDIAERRLPQDGRMRVKVSGKDYDLRVSFLPTVHGEKIVLRVLDKSNLSAAIDKLGLDPATLKQFRNAVDAPHGLLLVTGPTGSGKTTTLYSALNELNNPTFNIITVEDPVEFQIPGINQVPVKKEIGLSFASALRSILRQDPDIIMIGEIRDTETAEIAVEAALTGHQVLSTMHCNDAPGAIVRLDDMGIAPFLISSSVILACAQRLMRRICPHCKEQVTYPAKMYSDLNIEPSLFEGVPLFRGRGCERCKGSGYSGRLAIIEAMTVTDDIRKVIIGRGSTQDMAEIAKNQGMRNLRTVALDRAREGSSTLEQVLVLTSSH